MLLGSVTVAACIPRLTRHWFWWFVGWYVFLVAALGYWVCVSFETRHALGSWVAPLGQGLNNLESRWTGAEVGEAKAGAWLIGNGSAQEEFLATGGVLILAAGLVFFVPMASSRWRFWGGTPLLIIVGGMSVLFLVGVVMVHAASRPHAPAMGPLWPLLLAGAAFFYLWWLAALVFNLAFVWHRYIRYSVIEDHLRNLKPDPGTVESHAGAAMPLEPLKEGPAAPA